MIQSAATIVLAYYFLRECMSVYRVAKEGRGMVWTAICAFIALVTLIPLVAVWL